MKIAISGTHSTGKTTLINRLKPYIETHSVQKFEFVDGVTREAAKQGFPINELGSDETQLYCASKDMENLLKYQSTSFISDRCIWDTKIYSEYLFSHGKITFSTYNYIRGLFEKMIENLDMIFLLQPEFGLVDDGVRSKDVQFQKEIHDLFISQSSVVMNKGVWIIQVSGDTESRCSQIIQYINGY